MDSIESVQADIVEVFGWRDDSRPQERAHDYLRRYHVCRSYDDTAMQCVVAHLVDRAVAVAGGGAARDALERIAGICAEFEEEPPC